MAHSWHTIRWPAVHGINRTTVAATPFSGNWITLIEKFKYFNRKLMCSNNNCASFKHNVCRRNGMTQRRGNWRRIWRSSSSSLLLGLKQIFNWNFRHRISFYLFISIKTKSINNLCLFSRNLQSFLFSGVSNACVATAVAVEVAAAIVTSTVAVDVDHQLPNVN